MAKITYLDVQRNHLNHFDYLKVCKAAAREKYQDLLGENKEYVSSIVVEWQFIELLINYLIDNRYSFERFADKSGVSAAILNKIVSLRVNVVTIRNTVMILNAMGKSFEDIDFRSWKKARAI
jgi:hypothetical protein